MDNNRLQIENNETLTALIAEALHSYLLVQDHSFSLSAGDKSINLYDMDDDNIIALTAVDASGKVGVAGLIDYDGIAYTLTFMIPKSPSTLKHLYIYNDRIYMRRRGF